jgi:hypothetical protein
MYQEIEEPIDVIALFEKGRMRPVRFRWKERVYRIAKVTGDWQSEVGRYRLRHFAVIDEASNFFELSFDQYDSVWSLAKVSAE